MVDALSTLAATPLVGRRLVVDRGRFAGRVAVVREVFPHAGIDAVSSHGFGIWRRVDVDLDEVQLDGRRIESLGMRADDVTLSAGGRQRLRVGHLDVTARIAGDEVAAWSMALPSGIPAWIEDGTLLARPRWQGLRGVVVELEPFVDGRSIGVRVERGRIAGRVVSLPRRLRRVLRSDPGLLPHGSTLTSIGITDGQIEVAGSLAGHEIALDLPRLVADLGSRRGDTVIRVFRRR